MHIIYIFGLSAVLLEVCHSSLQDFQGEINIADDNLWGLSKLPGISTHIHAHCNNADTELGHEIIRAYKENVYPILDKLQSGINPFTPEFLKWAQSSLNLGILIVANMGLVKNNNKMANSVGS